MISEFGGIGWATEGGWGYGEAPKSFDDFYHPVSRARSMPCSTTRISSAFATLN